MLPPFWGFVPATNAMLQQMQRELEQLCGTFGNTFNAMLAAHPVAVAQTPSDIVYTEGRMRLLHYRPVVAQPQPVPLLIVPSLINRYYLFDLAPGKSLVEYLLGRGIDVYIIDWSTPEQADRFVTLDHYIIGYLRRAVQQVRELSGQERISLLGYSIGGTFTAMFSALYGRYARNLVQLAAPVDFHHEGLLAQWMHKDRFNVDQLVDTLGNMPGELMQASFRMIKPTMQIAQQVTLAQNLGNTEAVQDFLALQTWLQDNVPFPGEVYRKYVKECYQQNLLIAGKMNIGSQRVDLGRIDCSLLAVAASDDRICPPRSVTALNDVVASDDKQVLELSGGHIGMIVGRRASSRLWPHLAEWLLVRSS